MPTLQSLCHAVLSLTLKNEEFLTEFTLSSREILRSAQNDIMVESVILREED